MMNFKNPDSTDLHFFKREYQPKFLDNGDVDISHLLHVVQDLAGDHVEALGLGEDFKKENQFFYVVMRMKGYFLSSLNKEEKYTIITYPMQASGIQMYRYGYILNKDDEPVFYLSTLWILMDSVNRRIKSTKVFRNKLAEVLPDIDGVEPLTEETLENFSIDEYDFKYVKDYQVIPEDIDSNGHLNNTIYLKMSQPLLGDVKVKTFEIDFEKECFLDEKIALSLARENDSYIIRGDKEDHSLSFKIKINA
jgi:acyl-ACP thioesterase